MFSLVGKAYKNSISYSASIQQLYKLLPWADLPSCIGGDATPRTWELRTL